MNRRTFVATTGCLATLPVAGCLDADATTPGDENETGADDTVSTGDDSQETMYPRIEPDPLDGIEPLAYEISIASEPTSESPLTIEVVLTNTGEEAITYGERRTAMFWQADGDTEFSLYPTESVEYEYEEGVWWLPDGFMTTTDFQTAMLDPSETHTETLAVLHQPVDDEDELRALPSTLRFDVEFSYSTDEDELPDGNDVSWGFGLHIEEE